MAGDNERLATALWEAETELNQFKCFEVGLGSLFSEVFAEYFKTKKIHDSPKLLVTSIFYIFKSLFKRKKWRMFLANKRLLITKLTKKAHISSLVDPFNEIEDALFVVKEEDMIINNYLKYSMLPSLSCREALVIILGGISNSRTCSQLLGKKGIIISPRAIFSNFLVQFARCKGWINLLTESSIQLILTDFDRSGNNSPIVCAAKKLGIHSITLTHGVINPPYGYSPLLANEIWCWGNFQKKLLMELGINEYQIIPMGNPIARINQVYPEKLAEIFTHYKISKSDFVIGIALNPFSENRKFTDQLIGLVTEAVDTVSNKEIIILLKLHPSQSVEDINPKNLNSNRVMIFDGSRYNNFDFFSVCSLLLTHNSGLGFEAIVNDTPVGIIDNIPVNLGNGSIMAQYASAPVFRKSSELAEFLLKENAISLSHLLKIQNRFVLDEYYGKIGEEASSGMVRTSKRILQNSTN